MFEFLRSHVLENPRLIRWLTWEKLTSYMRSMYANEILKSTLKIFGESWKQNWVTYCNLKISWIIESFLFYPKICASQIKEIQQAGLYFRDALLTNISTITTRKLRSTQEEANTRVLLRVAIFWIKPRFDKRVSIRLTSLVSTNESRFDEIKFTLLYSPWDPYKLCCKKKELLFTKDLV